MLEQIQISKEAERLIRQAQSGLPLLGNKMGMAVQTWGQEKGEVKPIVKKYGQLYNNAIGDIQGYQYNALTTLTTISRQVIEQMYYMFPIENIVPVQTSVGAWGREFLHVKAYNIAGLAEAGIQTPGVISRRPRADVRFDYINQKIINWAMEYGTDIFEQNMSAANQINLDVVNRKAESVYVAWRQMLQRVAHFGLLNDNDTRGVLTQQNVDIDTTTFPVPFGSAMSDQEFFASLQIWKEFWLNTEGTMYPDTLLMSEVTRANLAIYPVTGINAFAGSRLDYLEMTFKKVTGNPNAQVVGSKYCEGKYLAEYGIVGVAERMALYRKQPDNLIMNLPVPYSTAAMGSADNVEFQAVSYAQFTGVLLLRDVGMKYFDVLEDTTPPETPRIENK